MKDTLTTGEIAHYCGVNFRTVIRWIDSGRLRAYQLPGRDDNRVAWSDFIAFLSALEARQTPLRRRAGSGAQRVFIVDDDALMCRACERVLLRAGYSVALTTDSFSAGILSKVFAPSLLITDLLMPGINGLDLIRLLQRDKNATSPWRILAISGAPTQHLQKAHQSGADAILAKPFDADRLISTVRQLIGDSAGGRELVPHA